MSQPANPQFDPKTIETLKAARNQVVQDESPEHGRGADKSGNSAKSGSLPTGQADVSGRENKNTTREQNLNPTPMQFAVCDKFAEEFVQKMTSLEQETAAVDEEIAKMEKIWLNLTEKKKQLENRRSELIRVKDKITTLNKEMDDVLSKEL